MSDGEWTGATGDLEEVLRLSADPITVQDASGRLVYANEAAARQMGFSSPEALLAAPVAELLARYELTDERGAPLALDDLPGRRALRGEREPAAIVGFRVNGEPRTRWSTVRATPVMRDGNVRFVINAFRDISRQKSTEDRLRLLADAGAVLAASDQYPDTLQALAELLVPRLADWCVVDVVELTGLRRVAVAHPDPARRAMAEDVQRRYPPDPTRPGGVAEVIRTGRTLIVETVTDEMVAAAARDAEHLELIRALGLRSAAIVPLVARGQVLGAITLAGSDSGHSYGEEDRQFLEDLGRRAAVAVDNARLLHDANDAVRLRDDFMAMASHDMRTPLQTILASIEMAGRRVARIGDGDAPEMREQAVANLAQAQRTTDRLARLVADLMDLVMLRTGKTLPLDFSDVDLLDLARSVADEHQATAGQHRISVTGSADGAVRTDPTRLERALDNLIENAVKYSPDGGDVMVEVTHADDGASITVRDQGIGIPVGELESIFETYRRASNASMMRGIGLGLSGARAVVRQLGGELTVESDEGTGSTFTIRLPTGSPAPR